MSKLDIRCAAVGVPNSSSLLGISVEAPQEARQRSIV